MTASISPEVRALMRLAAAALEPYDPAFKPTRINLSANENTYPMPPAVRAAIDADKTRLAESAPATEDDGDAKPAGGGVSFFQRAVPLLELLERSLKDKVPVTWGV